MKKCKFRLHDSYMLFVLLQTHVELTFPIFVTIPQLKLDEKRMSPREFWKRQIIVASQQRQPASFGFYSPAKGDAGLEGTINTNRV